MISLEECWRWPGYHRPTDDRATVGGKYVYRLLYEAAGGDEADTKSLHHKCENAWCVNPWHLEPLTQSAHMQEHGFGGDWGQADKQVCSNGHPYSPENTYVYQRKNGSTERHCRICVRDAKARYRESRRQK